MATYILICICIFGIVYPCNGDAPKCTKFKPNEYNFGNSASDVDFYKALLQPFKMYAPIFNNATVPNVGKVIEQFQDGKENEDVYLTITELIKKYGYPVEEHVATTEDKYCLTMHRIPRPGAPVAFLQHGLLCSSDDWVTTGTITGLAYTLYDAGYDVWMGNNRGNKHARCNLELSPDCGEFWQFSFDQMALYDIPAMIDYTLDYTKEKKLFYIAHSQGTTAFFAMAAARPEYNPKIKLFIALSAVVYCSHLRSPLIQLLSPFVFNTGVIYNTIGAYELAPREAFVDALTSTFCGSPELAEIFCNFAIFAIAGFDYPEANITRLPVLYGHYPAGGSVREAIHYAQLTVSKTFSRYRFDSPIENILTYGSPEPPEYPLEKMTCPTAIFYSNNDWQTSASDIFRLLHIVPNVQHFYRVPCGSYDHFDFLYAKDNNVLINKEILRLLTLYVNDDY